MQGKNPMRWDCEKQGCFNIKRRPKIEVFSDCFPNNISFGDVDGIVEINGYGLLLEWKQDVKCPPMGQHIMYQKLTKTKLLTVFLVIGHAETMEVSHIGGYYGGKQKKTQKTDLEGVKTKIKNWVQRAQANTI